jgi:hypothetical protein
MVRLQLLVTAILNATKLLLVTLKGSYCSCSLSLWRVARGSKRMFLELIHGLFIT